VSSSSIPLCNYTSCSTSNVYTLVAYPDTTTVPWISVSYNGTDYVIDAYGNANAGVSSFTGDGTLLSNSGSTGAVTATLANAGAHKYFGNNTGSSAAPAYDSLVAGDLPLASGSAVGAVELQTTLVGSTPVVPQEIAYGTAALPTSAIGSGACSAACQSGSCTGGTFTVTGGTISNVATTDNIQADFNADPTSTTGYSPTSNGILTIIKYPTSGNVNFKVCNNTAASITPGSVTLNWRVVR
jgi:hypothetical protein